MKIAVVCFVEHEGSIIMYNRWSIDQEAWTVLGGHLEDGEKILDCAQREIYEEAGVKVDKCSIFAIQEIIVKGEQYLVFYTHSNFVSWSLESSEDQIKQLSRVKNDSLPKKLYSTLDLFIQGKWVTILDHNIRNKWAGELSPSHE